MTRDEIMEIARLVEGDDKYSHFVKRINKEFDLADEDRKSQVHIIFQKKDNKKIGFCVIGHSPAKMRTWENVFKEEGWVDKDFEMKTPSYELMYMYIKPDLRKKGFGNKLLKKAFGFAKNKDVDAIYSYVSDKTPNSLEFYKRMDAKIIQDFSDSETSAAFLSWNL